MMAVKTFAILTSLLIFFFVIELIRRQKTTFKYSLFWIITCTIVLFFTYHDGLLRKISQLAGFELLSNFIFFLLLVFFIVLSLILTIYVNEQNNRSDLLAQSVGMLEYELKRANQKITKLSQSKKEHPSEKFKQG